MRLSVMRDGSMRVTISAAKPRQQKPYAVYDGSSKRWFATLDEARAAAPEIARKRGDQVEIVRRAGPSFQSIEFVAPRAVIAEPQMRRLVVSAYCIDQSDAWREDTIIAAQRDGMPEPEITYTKRSAKLLVTQDQAESLLEYCDTWADAYAAGGDADVGDPLYQARLARTFASARDSLRKQLADPATLLPCYPGVITDE